VGISLRYSSRLLDESKIKAEEIQTMHRTNIPGQRKRTEEMQLPLFMDEDEATPVNLDAPFSELANENARPMQEVPAPDVDRRGESATALDLASPDALVASWLNTPQRAFRAWRESMRTHGSEFAAHSLEQYESMFSRFLDWLGDRALHLESVDAARIEAFLEGLRGGRLGDKPAAPSTRRRYLLLLHHTFAHLQFLGVRADLPTAGMTELAPNQAFLRPAPTFLSPKVTRAYIAWCQAQDSTTWADERDRAIRLLFLAAGLTTAELQRLCVGDALIDDDEQFAQLRIAAHGFVPERAAPVADYAAQPLSRWLQARHAQLQSLAPSERLQAVLFPGIAPMGPVPGEPRPSRDAICANEAYLLVKTGLVAIGQTGSRLGPQTLRNTFIARQIDQGHPTERIMDWCGLLTAESVRAVQRMVPKRTADGLMAA
jgi:site-specific recombinase XerD